MSTTQIVSDYIAQNNLMPPKAKIIVGVSGGADSVALLDILHHLGYVCIVAHCNFHLRGEESYRDEYFVEKLAVKYKMQYTSTHFDTKKHVKDNSMSIEMAARELRYAWFEKIRVENEANCIAVAHHADDSVETVLLNLIRGTGIRGLTGISPINGSVVRPLLCLSRDNILEYLQDNNLSAIEDSTNLEEIYTRNKIRLSIIPLLETINPSVKQTIKKVSSNLTQVENIYISYINNAIKAIFVDSKINIAALLEFTEPKTILFEILFPYGFSPATIDNIFESIDSQSGKIFHSASHSLIKDRNCFILHEADFEEESEKHYSIEKNDVNTSTPIKLNIETLANNENVEFDKNPNIIYIDKDKVRFPLIIRRWQHGDWFVPFGMNGKKKLSDFFTDKKYSLPQKKEAWILANGSKIIWIIGERCDNRFRISETTKQILKISLTE